MKPCPICDSALTRIDDRGVIIKKYRVACEMCGCTSGWRESKSDARESWDRRPAAVAVDVKDRGNKRYAKECSVCGTPLRSVKSKDMFCPGCGRMVF